MSNEAASLMIHHLMNNTPFYLSSRFAEIFWNFNGGTKVDVLASFKSIIGPRDTHHYYVAAQHAHDAMAAV